MSNVDSLDYEQVRIALRFLLYRMSMETRLAMMAELPVTYARLYPMVSADRIAEQVTNTIHLAR